MKNVTPAPDEEILVAARRYAVDHGTSVNPVVREHLEALLRDDARRRDAAARLRRSLESSGIQVGARAWSRDDLTG